MAVSRQISAYCLSTQYCAAVAHPACGLASGKPQKICCLPPAPKLKLVLLVQKLESLIRLDSVFPGQVKVYFNSSCLHLIGDIFIQDGWLCFCVPSILECSVRCARCQGSKDDDESRGLSGLLTGSVLKLLIIGVVKGSVAFKQFARLKLELAP